MWRRVLKSNQLSRRRGCHSIRLSTRRWRCRRGRSCWRTWPTTPAAARRAMPPSSCAPCWSAAWAMRCSAASGTGCGGARLRGGRGRAPQAAGGRASWGRSRAIPWIWMSRPPGYGDDADRCMRRLLPVQGVRHDAEAQARRLLRLLQLWHGPLPADPAGTRRGRRSGVLWRAARQTIDRPASGGIGQAAGLTKNVVCWHSFSVEDKPGGWSALGGS